MNELGLISSRSFEKLNTIRNKIEHEYYVPDENKIATFYDLTFALISSIEWFLLSFSIYHEIDFSSDEEKLLIKDYKLCFSVKYNFELPSIEFKLSSEGQEETLNFNSNNYKEFIFAFSTYILLIKSHLIFNRIHFLKEFNKLHQTFMKKTN
ncbi:MAG: hypothetical protein NTZ60_06925 [Campylobacterales bacterium]|nr:hypothetical protein [Campylobacterales bacterium]